MRDSGLYIQKILTKREMINCQKFNLLLFLTLNSVTTGVRDSLETCAFEELGSEFINFASNCVINTLRLFVYLTGLRI